MSERHFTDIKACVFDAYGTLFDVHSAVGKFRDEIGPRHADLSMAWRTRQLEYTWLRSMMGEHCDFWQVTSDALTVSLAAIDSCDTDLHERLMQAYLSLDAFAEVKQVLTLLKRSGMRTAILTNGSPSMIKAAVVSAGLDTLIDHQLSVEAVGIFKPDARVYQLAVDTLDVDARQISFQSSNAWDAAGAAHFGFRVAWINRYAQPREVLPGNPHAELKDLSSYPALLGIC